MSALLRDAWVEVTTLDDLWEGEMLPVRVDDVDVLLVHTGDEVVAFEDRCPHVATPLSSGIFDGEQLTCVSHQWTFSARSGRGVNPAVACLKRFAVKVEGDAVSVNVSDVLQESRGMA